MEYIGLIFEIIFLILGIYLYLFSRGQLKSKDPNMQAKAEAFRQKNATWLRLFALAIMAIMALNIVVHISQLLSN